MAIEQDAATIVALETGGLKFDVNAVELFAGAVGGDPINAKTVLQLLQTEARKNGGGFQPDLVQALDVLEKAGEFYDIRFGHQGKPGYSVVKRFSDPPVTFENSYNHHVRVRVDPKEVASFALQNAGWICLPPEE